jgi:hypothetical protein
MLVELSELERSAGRAKGLRGRMAISDMQRASMRVFVRGIVVVRVRRDS